MSLDAVERQGMPFRGETGGIGPGQGMGAVPGTGAVPGSVPGTGAAAVDDEATDHGNPASPADREPRLVAHQHLALGSRRSIPLDPDLAARLEAARSAASEHDSHGERRAPRPERLQR
jgi:hypothetical protein